MAYDVMDFQKEVVERSLEVPVLVDFWAEWCGPCRILGPVLERLAGESNGRWVLAKLNTEEHREIAQQYRIYGIPNVKLFVDGKVVNEFVGALPEHQVRQWLAKALPSRYRRQVEQAEALLLAGREREARTTLEPVVREEPENHEARVLFARTLLKDDPARAAEAVRGIEEDSEFFDPAEAVRTVARLAEVYAHPDSLAEDPVKQTYLDAIGRLNANDFDGALERFIRVIRDNRYYDDDGARKACIAIFKLLGEEHETTQKHRRGFSSALY